MYSVCFVALWNEINIVASIDGINNIEASFNLSGLRAGIATLGEPLASVKMDSSGESVLSRDLVQPFDLSLSMKSWDEFSESGEPVPHIDAQLKTQPLRLFGSFYTFEQTFKMVERVKSSIKRFQDQMQGQVFCTHIQESLLPKIHCVTHIIV